MHLNLLVGWVAMIGGAFSGAGIGLYFHDDQWLGGYASFRRRMLRLGHIAFFGLGILNVLFALSAAEFVVRSPFDRIASMAFALGAITMPACCFLTAWRPYFRHVFVVPVLCVAIGLTGVLGGLQ